MKVIDPKTTPASEMYQYLIGTVNPRPIAFVSTVDRAGNPNLAPFSFFNIFSSNPPILVFATSRRITNNTTKDTLANIQETGEAVINAVSFRIARQMAVASVSFPYGVNEFEKSGLTPIPSDLVRPFRVKESPVHFECKLRQSISLGDQGGAGILLICEVLRMHVDPAVLDAEDRINPHKLDLIGRMGRAYYVRASGEAIHKIYQPQDQPAIGFDQLPASARRSTILTGNNLGQLAGIPAPPQPAEWKALKKEPRILDILATPDTAVQELHRYAQIELAKENTGLAASIVWLAEELASETH